MNNISFSSFRKKQLYLPAEFRDTNIHGFHNQKDFFRSLWMNYGKEDPVLNWVNFHVIVVDFFLHGLARFGYHFCLSRKNLNFLSYEDLSHQLQEKNSMLLSNIFAKAKGVEEQTIEPMVIPDASNEVKDWIKNKEHLPKEWRDEETMGLMMAFLIASIDCSDNFMINRVSPDKRVEMCKIFLDSASIFGFVVKKHNRPGDFENLMEIIEDYREDYRELKAGKNKVSNNRD